MMAQHTLYLLIKNSYLFSLNIAIELKNETINTHQ